MRGRFVIGATWSATLGLSLTACLQGPANHADGPAISAAQALNATWRKTRGIDAYKIDETMSYSGFSQPSGSWRRTGDVRLRPTLAESMVFVSGSEGGRSVAGTREIVVGDVEYVTSAAYAAYRPAKPWIKRSLAQAWEKLGVDYNDYAQQMSQVSLADEIRMLTSSKDARMVGAETVAGTPTTHYTGTISIHDAWAHFDDKIRSQVEQHYRRLGITTSDFDIWVDRDSLPRKMSTHAASRQGSQRHTVQCSDFGETVTITAPAPDLVGPPPRPGG